MDVDNFATITEPVDQRPMALVHADNLRQRFVGHAQSLSTATRNKFAENPAKRNQTYLEHLNQQSCRGLWITAYGVGILVNGLFPFWFDDAGVRLTKWLNVIHATGTRVARAVDEAATDVI